MRLVLIFQKCAWSSLEINIFLSLALQDAPRSVSCNLFAFFPLHTLSFTSSKSSGDYSDIQSRPFEFFPQCPLFCPLSFFPLEITVDVRKIILAFPFRLVSLRSTGSLIFLSLLTQPLFSCCLRLEKGSSGGTNYGHIKILFTRPFSYFSTKSSLISFKRPFDFPVKILADFISLNPLT